MGYLAPAFTLLTVLAVVPVLLHLFGRPRAERRKFAAIAFLLNSERQTAAKRKLREILLVVARASAIAAVPLVLSKPFCETASDLPSGIGSGRAESAVIVLDDSRSMGLVLDGKSLFEAARARATKLVEGLGRDSEVAILLTSAGAPAPQAELTADRARLKRVLADARPTHKTGDTAAAIRRAAAILSTAPQNERRIYLIGDLAAHGFGDGPIAPAGVTLVPVDAASGRALPNRAVVELRVEPSEQLGPRGLKVDATIANFSDEPAKGLAVTLRVDGQAVATGLVDVAPRGRALKRFFHLLPSTDETARADQPHDLAVEIPPDALADDDARFVRVQLARQLRALIVDGDPRTIRRDDEAFFLETALSPGERGDSRIEVAVVTVEDLARRRLDEFDVVCLANVKALDGERAASLRAFVEKGGGLLIGMGDNVDPEAWNGSLGALLPQPLATVRTVGATWNARDDGEARLGGAGERIARFDRRHPVLAPFGGDERGPAEALRSARVSRYVLLKPTLRARDDERAVLLRLDGGAPLLVEGRAGAGRVLLLTTTLDRDWSDLAIQPAFLPLMQQAVRWLAGTSLRAPDAASLVGWPHDVPLVDGDGRVEVTTPSGAVRTFEGERVAGRRALAFAETDEPGIYRVAAGGGGVAGRVAARPAAAFAVDVDPSESDLRAVEPARLRGADARRGDGRARAPRRRVELWHGIGAALLALLFVEGALAARRRR